MIEETFVKGTGDGSLFLFISIKPFIYKDFRPSSGIP